MTNFLFEFFSSNYPYRFTVFTTLIIFVIIKIPFWVTHRLLWSGTFRRRRVLQSKYLSGWKNGFPPYVILRIPGVSFVHTLRDPYVYSILHVGYLLERSKRKQV